MQTNWIAFVGPPCSGKTTIAEEFEKMGWLILSDAARDIVEYEQLNGKNARSDERRFQMRVEEYQYERERLIEPFQAYILDGAYPDNLAHHKLYGMNTDMIRELSRRSLKQYKMIFLFEKLPIKQDGIIIETEDQRDELTVLLSEAYRSLGYDYITVPVMPVEDRVEFVKERIVSLKTESQRGK